MTTQELKSEIQKSIDKMPDDVLKDVLDYLKLAESLPKNNLTLLKNLRLILTEDKELLQKLAQ